MGCGGSKENPNKIYSEMKNTKVQELDSFFRTAEECLSGLEELRASFVECIEEMNDTGRTEELKEPKLIEAFRVFFWSVSAHKDGNIILADTKFTTDPIAFTVECGSMYYKTWDFSDAFKQLIGAFTGAPAKIIELGKNIKEVGEKAVELSKSFSDTVKGAGLNPMDAARAVANCGANFKRITEGVKKAPLIFKAAEEAIKEMKEVIPAIQDMIVKADEVGKKAHEKRHLTMDDIFEHYQTAPKKTHDEIKAEKKKNKGKWVKPSRHAHTKAQPHPAAKKINPNA